MDTSVEPKKKRQRVGQEAETFTFNSLTDGCILRIFSFLNVKENFYLQLVCSQWKKIADDPALWRHFFFCYFPGFPVTSQVVEGNLWREAFMSKLDDIRIQEMTTFLLRIETAPNEQFFEQFTVFLSRVLHLAGLEGVHPSQTEAFQKKELVPMFCMMRFAVKNILEIVPIALTHMIHQARLNRADSFLLKFRDLSLMADINGITLLHLFDFLTLIKKAYLQCDPKTFAALRSKDFVALVEETVRQLILYRQFMEQHEALRRLDTLLANDPSGAKFQILKNALNKYTAEVEGSNQMFTLKKYYVLNSHADYWNRLEMMRQNYTPFLQKVLKQAEGGNAKGKKNADAAEKSKQMKALVMPVLQLLQLKPETGKEIDFLHDVASLDAAERKIKVWFNQLKEESARRKTTGSKK